MTIKVIKNSARNAPPPVQKNYVPNYRRLGMEPIVQSYEEEIIEDLDEVNLPSPRVTSGRGVFPASGNNQDHLWTSNGQDDSIYEQELVVHENTHGITFDPPSRATVGFVRPIERTVAAPTPQENPTLQVGQFILLINDEVVIMGSKKLITEKISHILSGSDPAFDADHVSAEDFVVLERVNVSVGVLIG